MGKALRFGGYGGYLKKSRQFGTGRGPGVQAYLLYPCSLKICTQVPVQATNPIPARTGVGSSSRHKVCQHGKRRTRCPQCNGNSLCEHSRQKLHCRDCRHMYTKCASFCQHGRQRSRCKECGGSGICVHGREKYRCSKC